MGRVRPTYIKRVAIELVRNYSDRFNEDFDHIVKILINE